MTRYRRSLPQLTPQLFLTDGGIETTLIYHDGFELPEFAAFALLQREDGRAALLRYFRAYADIARRHGSGLILESATWRASSGESRWRRAPALSASSTSSKRLAGPL